MLIMSENWKGNFCFEINLTVGILFALLLVGIQENIVELFRLCTISSFTLACCSEQVFVKQSPIGTPSKHVLNIPTLGPWKGEEPFRRQCFFFLIFSLFRRVPILKIIDCFCVEQNQKCFDLVTYHMVYFQSRYTCDVKNRIYESISKLPVECLTLK